MDVNGERAKPHRELRVGDALSITTRRGDRRELLVRGLAERSLPKAQARKLCEDVTPPLSPEMIEARRLDRMMRGGPAARPSARDRRAIRKWKGKE